MIFLISSQPLEFSHLLLVRGIVQFDIFGNAHGLLASHPLTPFISMHHLELIAPVFPNQTALDGLSLLTEAMRAEPGSFLQQSLAYDWENRLSFSISTGYVVQVTSLSLLPVLGHICLFSVVITSGTGGVSKTYMMKFLAQYK